MSFNHASLTEMLCTTKMSDGKKVLLCRSTTSSHRGITVLLSVHASTYRNLPVSLCFCFLIYLHHFGNVCVCVLSSNNLLPTFLTDWASQPNYKHVDIITHTHAPLFFFTRYIQKYLRTLRHTHAHSSSYIRTYA